MFGLFSKATSALGSFLPQGTATEHAKDAATHLKAACGAFGEATMSAAKAGVNLSTIAGAAVLGAGATGGLVQSAFYINAGLQALKYISPVAFAPVVGAAAEAVKFSLVQAVYHPIATISMGALGGIAMVNKSVKNCGENIGNAAYKTGEAAIEVAKAGGEIALASAIVAKDVAIKSFEVAKTATEYAIDIAEYVAEKAGPVASNIVEKASDTKQHVVDYLDRQKGFGVDGKYSFTNIEPKFTDSLGFEEISLEDSINTPLSGDWTLIDMAAPAA